MYIILLLHYIHICTIYALCVHCHSYDIYMYMIYILSKDMISHMQMVYSTMVAN